MLKAFNSELGHEKLWKDRKPSDVMPTIPHPWRAWKSTASFEAAGILLV